LIHDSVIAKNINQTIENLKQTSIGLDETMGAVQEDVSAIMVSLKVTTGNAEVFSQQLEEIMVKVNDENGTFTKIIQDTTIASNLSQTMENLNSSTKGLDENMEALKHNIFFRGYYNKKQKAEAEAAEAKDKENKTVQK